MSLLPPDPFMAALPACPGCGCRLRSLIHDVENDGDGHQWEVTIEFHCDAKIFSCRNTPDEARKWYAATGCQKHFQEQALGTPPD